MAVKPIYEVSCDFCRTTLHIDSCSNKAELALELQARDWIVTGKCIYTYCSELCAYA